MMTGYNAVEEKQITEAIAKTFHFNVITGSTGNVFYKCVHCGKRFEERHYGKFTSNDRMIMHAKRHGITHEGGINV